MTSLWSRFTAVIARHPWPAFIVGALLLVLIVHGASLRYTFVSDDYDWLTTAEQNLAAGQPFKPLWTPIGGNFYRPMPALSLTLDTWVAGRNAAVFHAHQVLCFFLLVLAVAWFLETLTKRRRLAFAVAALFAVYPAHHEVVSWLAGRPDLLATLWLVVSAGGVAKYLRTPRWYWLAAICISTALSMLSKESGFVAPGIHLLVIVAHKLQHRDAPWRRVLMAVLPAVFLLVGVLLIRSRVLTDAIGGYIAGGEQLGLHFAWRDLLAPVTSAFVVLNLDYFRAVTGTALIGPTAIRLLAVVGVVVVAVIVLRAWRQVERRWLVGIVALGIAWAYITFVPALGLSSAIGSNLEGSRLFFGPSLGYCLIIVATGMLLWPQARSRRWILALLLVTFAVLNLFNSQPWSQASKQVSTIQRTLNQNASSLMPTSTTDVIVAGVPSKVYGAYAFWGPHITRAIVQSAASRSVNVLSVGTTAFSDSPYCQTDAARQIVSLRWIDKNQNWISETAAQARLQTAGQTGQDFHLAASSAGWTPEGLNTTVENGVTRYTIRDTSALIRLRLPQSVTGTTYRSIRLHFAEPLSTSGFNTRRIQFGWLRPVDNSRQVITTSISADATEFTIPLCQYPNWPMSEGVTEVTVAVGQQGTFALQSVDFLTGR